MIAGIFREIRRLAYPMKPYDNILRIKLERFEALEAKHVKGEKDRLTARKLKELF